MSQERERQIPGQNNESQAPKIEFNENGFVVRELNWNDPSVQEKALDLRARVFGEERGWVLPEEEKR